MSKTEKGNTIVQGKGQKGKRILINEADYKKFLQMKEQMARRELSAESKRKYGLEMPRGWYKGGQLATEKSAEKLTGFQFGPVDAGRGSKFLHRDFFKWAQGLIMHDETAIKLFDSCMEVLESEKTFEDFMEKLKEKEAEQKARLNEMESDVEEHDDTDSNDFDPTGPEAFEDLPTAKPNPNRDRSND